MNKLKNTIELERLKNEKAISDLNNDIEKHKNETQSKEKKNT